MNTKENNDRDSVESTDLFGVWLPIKTAPKDGTKVIGWSKRHGCHIGPVAPYKRPEMPKRYDGWFQPSHWMPLPELPNAEATREGAEPLS